MLEMFVKNKLNEYKFNPFFGVANLTYNFIIFLISSSEKKVLFKS